MKIDILAWIFFIICSKALPFSSCQTTLPTKAAGRYELLMQNNQHHKNESNKFVETSGKVGDQIRKEKGHENSHLNIFQKAKAVYGGADVQHRPATRSGASSILLRPSSLLSITVFGHAMAGWLVIVFLF